MADVCENVVDEDGNPLDQDENGNTLPTGSNSCTTSADGDVICPDTGKDKSCKPWQLTKTKDNCFIDNLTEEALAIGGADVYVFKLLGIHEQGKLLDYTDNGTAISSGDTVGFPKEEAFTTFVTEWRSAQSGAGVTASAYIGYDFGEIKLDNDRRRYGIETSIKHNISSLKIKQSNTAANRATKIRVERSEDGQTWFGARVITLPDDNCLTTVHFANTVPMRYWRLRPIEFNGGGYWGVQALEMYDYDLTSIDDIQDKIWHENRDRSYASESLLIKASYNLVDTQTDLSRFGIELPSQVLNFTMSFSSIVSILGRPIVVGDIFEVPSETQFNTKMEPIKKYMEVTDVTWSTEGYTPGWQPTLLNVTAEPMMATQETADIFGGLESYDDGTGHQVNKDGISMEDGNHPIFQDYSDISQTIEQTANDQNHTPERGKDSAEITQFSDEEKQAFINQGIPRAADLGLNPKQIYVEDAMPPNGKEFTEGETLPATGTNGAYHRQTYTSIDETIPARLFKFSSAKNRWLWVETDQRQKYANTKPTLQEYLSSNTAKPAKDIGK